MKNALTLVLALAVLVFAAIALLGREGDDTDTALQGGGGRAPETGTTETRVSGVAPADAEEITEIVALVASGEEPCDYYTDDALARFVRPSGPADAYEACLAAQRGAPKVAAERVVITDIAGGRRRATARYVAGRARGTIALVNQRGQWLVTRVRSRRGGA